MSAQPVGDEFQVNTHTASEQTFPAIAVSNGNSFVVVWQSLFQDDGNFYGVYGRRLTSSAAPTGAEFLVPVSTANQQTFADVAADRTGTDGFVVTWTSLHTGSVGIYARRFDSGGVPAPGEITVNTSAPYFTPPSAVGMDAVGNFVVGWEKPDGLREDVAARRFAGSGTALSGEFRVNTFTGNVQQRPDVAVSPDGTHVVFVWDSSPQDGSGFGVYGQRYDGNGVAQGAEFKVNTITANNQQLSSVAIDDAGNFVVVWSDQINGIYAQRFAADGTRVGTEIHVNAAPAVNTTSVAMNGAGEFIVTWDEFVAAVSNVFARFYDRFGRALGSEFVAPVHTGTAKILPSAAIDASGNAVIVWASANQEAIPSFTGQGIFGRRFAAPPPLPLPGALQFSTADFGALETAGSATITVTRTGGSGGSVSVDYATSNGTASAGSDYTAASGTITFGDGDVASKTFLITIVDDALVEPVETVTLTLSNTTGGATLGSPATAVLSLTSEDLPPPTGQLQFTQAELSVSEAVNAVLTVERVGGSAGPVTVNYAFGAGTATAVADYTPASGTLTFADGQVSRTIAVAILDDTVDEPDETLVASLSQPTGGATLGLPTETVVTIADDDDPVPSATGPFYLAEGATGFFELEFAVANPNDSAAPISASFLKPDGTTVTLDTTLLPTSRSTIRVNDIPGLEASALSTVVESKNGLALVVDRTMSWDRGSYYAAHTEKAGEGARRQWFFAEGSQGFFDTYVLLANPQPIPNTATVTFLVEGGSPVTETFELAPTSRRSVPARDIPALHNRSFGITVTFTEPGAAERSMYFGQSPFWNGGHASVGIAAPATTWYHAEGATGSFFDTYILVANPNAATATVSYKYFLDSGVVITKEVAVPANSRHTVNVEKEHPLLAKAAMSTQVTSNLPVVSERAMYWAGPFSSWYEAHNSFGLTATGTKWGIAEGRVGGTRGYQTYILLANPNDTSVAVTITYLRTNGTTVIKSHTVAPTSRFNVHVNKFAPELVDEQFAAIVEATQPIAVERALYWNAGGVFWAAGTNATAARLP